MTAATTKLSEILFLFEEIVGKHSVHKVYNRKTSNAQ